MLARLYLAWVFTPLLKFLKWKESVTGYISWKDVHFPLSPMKRRTPSLFDNHKSQGSNTYRQPDAPLPKPKLLRTARRFTRYLRQFSIFLLLTLSYSSKHFTLTLYGIKYLTLRHHCQVKTSAKCGDTKQRSFRELAEVPCVTFQLVPKFLSRIKIGKWFNWYCWCGGFKELHVYSLPFLPSHVFSRPALENEQNIIKALHFCRAKMISKETSKHTVNSEVTV